uniref:Membrane protein, putative n=1 Tax=Babesia bovis TaxID=5865 RepID=S6B5F6_BABBO|nr:membrane protein, putative [Babesia bovis]
MSASLLRWVLMLAAAVRSTYSLVTTFKESDGPYKSLRIPMCFVPVLGANSDQMYNPRYQFSLTEGGTIEGMIKVVNVLDGPVVKVARHPEELIKSMKNGIDYSNRHNPLRVRIRTVDEGHHQDHHSWFQLGHNLHKWFTRRNDDDMPLQEPLVDRGISDRQTLDNVYLLLMSKAKWDIYSSVATEEHLQPAKGNNKFIVSSNVAADMRIPISEVGVPIKFRFTAKETDRFVLMILNADERKLLLDGKITFMNPYNDHLTSEMKYFEPVISFWESVYRFTGILALAYLLLNLRSTANMVNYIMALNFGLIGLYLRLDRFLLDSLINTGEHSNILWTLAHVLRRIHENCLMGLLLLLALGWKILRPHLSGVEIRLVLSVTVFSCVVGFIEILIFGVDVTRGLVYTISFVAILIATNFNILLIRARVVDESLNSDAGIAYAHLKAYKLFKIGFFASILKPEIYSIIRGLCLQTTGDQTFVWDEHFMLFIDLFFDYVIYCVYFVAFMPTTQLPLFKHLWRCAAT